MTTKRQLQIINHYAAMMEEAKQRLNCIDAATSGLIVLLPPPALREFCFLQLRMLCELIALACLIAHGDITATQTKKLRQEWSPDRILAELEKLHPHFFPQPGRDAPPTEGAHRQFEALQAGYLTKAELLSLYGMCGRELHRGSIKSLFTATGPQPPADYSDIRNWRRKISELLGLHLIFLLDGKTHFICMLRNASDNNRVQVAIAEASEPPPRGL
jgi:hypothetical protein